MPTCDVRNVDEKILPPDKNAHIFRIHAKFDIGYWGIGVFAILFCMYITPNLFGVWISIILVIDEVIFFILDMTKRWQARWGKDIKTLTRYNGLRLYFVNAGFWVYSLVMGLVDGGYHTFLTLAQLATIVSIYTMIVAITLLRKTSILDVEK